MSAHALVVDASKSEAILFVNGAITRTPRAYMALVRQSPAMIRSARRSEGCLQVKATMASPREFILLSWWRNADALRAFYRDELHVRLMALVFEHPDWFTLYNETFGAPLSTRYWHELNGFGLSVGAT